MEEGFIRQRRNLLVMSIIIFIVSFASVDLGKSLVISGVKFTIKDTIVIYIFIWFMQIYFLVRYISYFGDLNSELKDYMFPSYPWHGYKEYYFERKVFSLSNIIKFLWVTFLFISNNILESIFFILNIIFKKSFLETLFPIIFAVFVMTTSYNSSFVTSKKDEAFSKIEAFYVAIYDETIGKVIDSAEEKVFEYKNKINEYSYSFFNKKIFDTNKSNIQSKLYYFEEYDN